MKRLKFFILFLFVALVAVRAKAADPRGKAPQQTFTNPPELRAKGGVHELRFGPVEHVIDGNRYCLRGYNDVIPGPTIRVKKAGSKKRAVRVNLYNEFTKQDFREVSGQEGQGEISCHDFNLTNLHAHGAHVRPDYAAFDVKDPCTGAGCGPDSRYFADNVLIEVAQSELAQFRWDIDEDYLHHPGINWYHPHIHGATAVQVSSGAAGALIVEGNLDQVRGVAKAKERVMVINHIPYTSEYVTPLQPGQACTEDTLSANNFLAVTQTSPTLVNGVLRPRIVTPPNQVERWRIVFGGSPDEMQMALVEGLDENCSALDPTRIIPLTQIAADGITFEQPFQRDWTFVSSGYRVEALVQMPDTPKTLCFAALRTRDVGTPQPGDVIVIVNVDKGAGKPTETKMPTAADLAAVAPPTKWTGTVDGQVMEASCASVTTIHQKAVMLLPIFDNSGGSGAQSDGGSCDPNEFGHGGHAVDNCECPEPNINCRKFDNRRALDYRSDRVMTVGDTEKWRVIASDGHPFHIHINPFVVCPTVTSREPPFAHWRDSYFVQADEPAKDFLMEFRKFTGQFVLHCHKLNHEDEGMMELTEVCAKDDRECLCLDSSNPDECISNAGCKEDDLHCQFAAAATNNYPAPTSCSEQATSSHHTESLVSTASESASHH